MEGQAIGGRRFFASDIFFEAGANHPARKARTALSLKQDAQNLSSLARFWRRDDFCFLI